MHIRRVRMKIFAPNNKTFIRRTIIAGRSRAFSEKGIDRALDLAAAAVERLYPEHEYTVVQTGPNSFNFIWQRERERNQSAPAETAEAVA